MKFTFEATQKTVREAIKRSLEKQKKQKAGIPAKK